MIKKVKRRLWRLARSRVLDFVKRRDPGQFRHNYAGYTFSQCGEDRILEFLFGQLQIHTPRYLDVGTAHPCVMNNTYLFYLAGASGVCVEPNPDAAALIRDKRPRDLLMSVGVTPDGEGECCYYMFTESTLNTFDAEEARARTESGLFQLTNKLSVPVVSLNSIISGHFKDGIDLLSLDAEGLDLSLLRSLDFAQCRPLAICVETVGYSETLAKPKANDFTTFLNSQGYAVFADTFVNTIYVDLQRTGSFAL